MQDRIPTKPNRYAVYDDAHNFVRYEYHERADEPTQTGDALNKANLLPDDVATALGLSGNPQVKDGLIALNVLANSKAKIEFGSYVGTGVSGSNNPNSLTFERAPRLLVFYAAWTKSTSISTLRWLISNAGTLVDTTWLTTSYVKNAPPYYTTGDAMYSKKSADGKTISWYNSGSVGSGTQLNDADKTYYYFTII